MLLDLSDTSSRRRTRSTQSQICGQVKTHDVFILMSFRRVPFLNLDSANGLLGVSVARLRKQYIIFTKGYAVFDLSDGTVDKIGFSFIEPRDFVRLNISRVSELGPDDELYGIVPVPSAKDDKLRLSGLVTAARFVCYLNLVRHVTNRWPIKYVVL